MYSDGAAKISAFTHTAISIFICTCLFIFMIMTERMARCGDSPSVHMCVCVYKVLCVSAVCHHWVSVFVGVFFISTLSSAAASLFIKLQRGGATRLARASISAPVFYTFLIFLSWSFFCTRSLSFFYMAMSMCVCVCVYVGTVKKITDNDLLRGGFFLWRERERRREQFQDLWDTHAVVSPRLGYKK